MDGDAVDPAGVVVELVAVLEDASHDASLRVPAAR